MGRAAITVMLIAALPAMGADLGAADAGLGWNDPLYATCPAAPQPEQLDGGSWLLSPARASRNACLAETCDDRRRTLEPIAAAPPPFSSGSLWIDLALFALGIAAGGFLGWGLREVFFR